MHEALYIPNIYRAIFRPPMAMNARFWTFYTQPTKKHHQNQSSRLFLRLGTHHCFTYTLWLWSHFHTRVLTISSVIFWAFLSVFNFWTSSFTLRNNWSTVIPLSFHLCNIFTGRRWYFYSHLRWLVNAHFPFSLFRSLQSSCRVFSTDAVLHSPQSLLLNVIRCSWLEVQGIKLIFSSRYFNIALPMLSITISFVQIVSCPANAQYLNRRFRNFNTFRTSSTFYLLLFWYIFTSTSSTKFNTILFVQIQQFTLFFTKMDAAFLSERFVNPKVYIRKSRFWKWIWSCKCKQVNLVISMS